MPETHGNGIEATVGHLGSLKLSGRDVLLAGCLIALGAGAIVVQWMTLTAFQSALARDVTRVFVHADRAANEREQIMALLKLRTCTDVFFEAARQVDPKLRVQTERTWGLICLGQSEPREPHQPEQTK